MNLKNPMLFKSVGFFAYALLSCMNNINYALLLSINEINSAAFLGFEK